jgi:hypothetical protein
MHNPRLALCATHIPFAGDYSPIAGLRTNSDIDCEEQQRQCSKKLSPMFGRITIAEVNGSEVGEVHKTNAASLEQTFAIANSRYRLKTGLNELD